MLAVSIALLSLTCLWANPNATEMRNPMPIEAKALADEPIPLWSGVAPGEKGDIGQEHDSTKPDPKIPPEQYIIRLANVTKPTIALYRPPKEKDTGAAVVVFPGGGYQILAMNLEGTEVCEWLNSIGVTAILLKYRVPARAGRERYEAPLQDAQRAVGLVRSKAAEWGIDPKRIGVLGFSAGAHLTATLCSNTEKRAYPKVDAADEVSCRPDFTFLLYPGYLVRNDDLTNLAPEIKVTANTPPAFVMMTQDDPVRVENALVYAMALQKAKVSVELHLYPVGGHGYGLRPSANPVSTWTDRAAEWLRAQGWLKSKP